MKKESKMFEIDEPYITAGPIDSTMFLNGTLTYVNSMKERLARIEQLCNDFDKSYLPAGQERQERLVEELNKLEEIGGLAIELRVLAGSLAYWTDAGDGDKQEDRMWRTVRSMYGDIVREWLMGAHPDEDAENVQRQDG